MNMILQYVSDVLSELILTEKIKMYYVQMKSAVKNTSDFDRTLLWIRKDYSASSFAHSNERLTAFFQPL